MRKSFFLLALTLTSASLFSAEVLPRIFSDDFSKGAGAWEPGDATAWKITPVQGNDSYEILGGSRYEPPFRSPLNLSLLKDHEVGDFVLTAKVQSKQEPRGHRDMCLIFGYQDPANFYYVHLGEKTDPHANQIFLVNEAPRIAISEKASAGTPWEVGKWHDLKVVRTVSTGLIEVYFDDMENPTHLAHDKTFTSGRIGLGTFDDMGLWDDVELRGVVVAKPSTAIPDPKQLIFTKWTPHFPVPDPVALSFDPQGRAYVTQTRRRKANDLDIRDNTDWIPRDLSFTSPAVKEIFNREQFVPANSEKNAHRVEDLNDDGLHDLKDLTVLSERIHLIADTDGDGFADETGIFAEQLDHLIGGVAGGVLYHEGEVFVSPVPELIKFRDTDGDDKADQRDVVASGFGVHLAYAGHDMHGLSIGPDGRIYWSVGDKGIRVKTADGLDYRFPHQGGLMRCEPDGSNFEVYAHGQRNIQEIAFDQYGNFFGVDNDADFAGEKERFVQIEQYTDLGWRSHWQYLRSDYNPWNDEQMHVPFHDGQPRWYTAPLGLYENGPAGFKANPGTGLGPAYKGYFFLTSAPNGQQWAFQIKAKGDSFAMVNDHQIGNGIPLVGLNFAPDGGLYGVDWGGGYPMNEDGAIWRIDLPAEKTDPLRAETRKWIGADLTDETTAQLVNLLGHADQRVRLKAQFTLAKRDALTEFRAVAGEVTAPQLARIHAIWGIGQLLRRGAATNETLSALFTDPDPELRAQAIKTVTDRFGRLLGLDRIAAPGKEGHALTPALSARLDDPSQRVRIQALLGLARLQDSDATAAIIPLLARPEHHHGLTYLRHAGVMALAGCATTETLAGLVDHPSDFLRTCAALALGKRGDAAVAAFLSDTDAVLAADAAVQIHDDWMIPEAMPALAAALGQHPEHGPFTRRAINANFRLGTAAAAERVAAFIVEAAAPEPLLEAGLEALAHWTSPGELDLVIGQYRPLSPRDPSLLATALEKHLDALLTSEFSSVRTVAMDLAGQTRLPIANETLGIVFANENATASLRSAALRLLASQKASNLAAIVETALDDPIDDVKITSLDLLAGFDPDKALNEISRRLDGPAPLAVKQHAIRSLPSVKGLGKMQTLLAEFKAGSIEPALQLDLYEAAKAVPFSTNSEIAALVKALESDWEMALATDPLAPSRITLEGGDAVRGKSIFLNHPAGQCTACHKVADGKGSNVGPNLKEIGAKKERAYLLEALLNPQAIVAGGYGSIALTLNDGTSLAGQFRSEKGGKIVLRDPDGKEKSVSVGEIKERSPVISTMPPMGFILQKSEIRDLIAYLVSLKG